MIPDLSLTRNLQPKRLSGSCRLIAASGSVRRLNSFVAVALDKKVKLLIMMVVYAVMCELVSTLITGNFLKIAVHNRLLAR
jgi:hypothetical protein